jgi:hypothetical protein
VKRHVRQDNRCFSLVDVLLLTPAEFQFYGGSQVLPSMPLEVPKASKGESTGARVSRDSRRLVRV